MTWLLVIDRHPSKLQAHFHKKSMIISTLFLYWTVNSMQPNFLTLVVIQERTWISIFTMKDYIHPWIRGLAWHFKRCIFYKTLCQFLWIASGGWHFKRCILCQLLWIALPVKQVCSQNRGSLLTAETNMCFHNRSNNAFNSVVSFNLFATFSDVPHASICL